MSREGGTGARDKWTLSHFRMPLSQPSSPSIASPHFGPVALRDTSANK